MIKLARMGILMAALSAPSFVQGAVVVRRAVAYRPVARAAVMVGTAAVTAAVVGSVVHSLPPQCSTMVVNGVTYQQCGSTWYQPQYAGTQVNYVVVNPPR